MTDIRSLTETKDFHADVLQRSEAFFLKGANSLQNRLARIFDSQSGRTVMLD